MDSMELPGAWEPAGSSWSSGDPEDGRDILFLSETKSLDKEMEPLRWKLNMPNMIVKDC